LNNIRHLKFWLTRIFYCWYCRYWRK